MTPEEKAKELIRETFCFFLGDNGSEEFWTDELECKRAALKCVEEIIRYGGTMNLIQYKPDCFSNGDDYWKEVKREIETYNTEI